MKLRLLILLFGLSSVLAGCMTTEEIQMRNSSKCSGYGFKVGTNAFAQCMMQLEKEDEKNSRCSSAYLAGYAAADPSKGLGFAVAQGQRAEADCQAARSNK